MNETRIIIGDSQTRSRKRLKELLTNNGYLIIGEAAEALGTLRLVRSIQPDLVILDGDLPGMSVLELAHVIEDDGLAPVLLIVQAFSREYLETARESTSLNLMVRPITEATLIPAVEATISKYRKTAELKKEIARLKQQLETRKIVEKAKGVLMEKLGISEKEAHRRLQKQSMDKSISIREVAEAVLLTSDLQQPKKNR